MVRVDVTKKMLSGLNQMLVNVHNLKVDKLVMGMRFIFLLCLLGLDCLIALIN